MTTTDLNSAKEGVASKKIDFDQNFVEKFNKDIGPLSFALFARVSRTTLGLTQEEFGKKIGLSRANVCDIEKGRQFVSVDLALKIVHKTGLPEKIALQACLQDQVYKACSKAKVAVI